ncbi:helix-turn-helix domain-containing protein [Flavobacterium qiangtangense]|uniref:helix-turn-helix domain-containing protein n=1 Tax=Flavobacterium qiangtangense TaxID=1442595 RepID=UPI0036D2897B
MLTEDDAQTLKYLSYIIVTISFYLTFLTLYYYNELTKIANSAVKEKPFNSEQQSVDDSTLMLLYLKIQEYIENNKPYTHPDFTINMLSKKVKSNPSYVSRAINQEGGKNFSDFIQEYRINLVKEEFIKKHGHVIIKEVYERAGFRQQATFNRNFKKFVGKTPSQYCFDLQKDYFLS